MNAAPDHPVPRGVLEPWAGDIGSQWDVDAGEEVQAPMHTRDPFTPEITAP